MKEYNQTFLRDFITNALNNNNKFYVTKYDDKTYGFFSIKMDGIKYILPINKYNATQHCEYTSVNAIVDAVAFIYNSKIYIIQEVLFNLKDFNVPELVNARLEILAINEYIQDNIFQKLYDTIDTKEVIIDKEIIDMVKREIIEHNFPPIPIFKIVNRLSYIKLLTNQITMEELAKEWIMKHLVQLSKLKLIQQFIKDFKNQQGLSAGEFIDMLTQNYCTDTI